MVGKELYPRNIDNTLNNYFFKAPITAPFAVSYFEEILLVKLADLFNTTMGGPWQVE